MTAPLIAITTYGRDEARAFALPVVYVEAVRRAGGVALLVPPGELHTDEVMERADGLMLTGGGDIDPAVYGGQTHETVYMVDADRDRMEMAMVKAAIADGLPTLAICRGSQVVNIALGGTLHVHLPEVVGETIKHRLPPREPVPHPVTVKPDTHVARILGQTECEPMSWHHQGIAELADPLRVTAHAPDGTIEAAELPDHPWFIAIQWHPELTAEKDPAQQNLFDELVKACCKKRAG